MNGSKHRYLLTINCVIFIEDTKILSAKTTHSVVKNCSLARQTEHNNGCLYIFY